MDAVHVRRAAVAGNSWSGGWAISFAQRHPERVSRLMLLSSSGLDVRDPWQWEIPKYPVVGELLTNLFTTKATVRDATRGVPTSDDRYRGGLLGVNRAADGGRRAWGRVRKSRAINTYDFEEEV